MKKLCIDCIIEGTEGQKKLKNYIGLGVCDKCTKSKYLYFPK